MAEETTSLVQLNNTHRAIYLKIGNSSFEQLGEGVTNFTPTNNPTVNTKHYINRKNPHTSISALSKQYAMSADRIKGDACNDYIASLEDKIGSDCVTELVDVDMSSSTTDGSYKAKKYNITIALNQPYSIEGGNDQQMDATFYVNGDPIEGTFAVATKPFTATPAA